MPFVMWMYFHLYLNSHFRHSWKPTRRSLWTFGLGRSVWHPMSSVSQSPGLSIIVTIAIVTVIIILSSNPSPSRTSPFWHASCLDKRMLQKAPKCPFWANIARSLFRSPPEKSACIKVINFAAAPFLAAVLGRCLGNAPEIPQCDFSSPKPWPQ